MVFRIPLNRYPVPQGTIDISTLKNPALTTAGGKYTPNLSAAVSERKKLPKGVYLIIASTFNPQQLGKFELTLYSGVPAMDYHRYQ